MATDPPINPYNRTPPDTESIKVGKETQKILGESLKTQQASLGLQTQAGFGKAGAAIGVIQMEALRGLRDTMDGHADALEKTAKITNDNIEKIRDAYGGLGLEEFDYIQSSAASNAVKRFQIIRFAAAETNTATMGMQQSGKELLESLTKDGVNIFDKYFDNAEQAAEKVQNVLGQLSTTYGKYVADMSDQQIAKLAFYEDSLGISADAISDLFQKQIGFAGEISLDSMDKLGVYASNLSKELNIPMKTLTDQTIRMMTNTEMFGDITVEEATRMSAKLTQLGYTYDELNQVQNKFATFSGAAQAAGTMAQLTGVQVDAMKMSYLASEGKFDELIEYQRDSLLKAGMTKEKFMAQSNSMRNAIAKAYGRSQEELAYLLSSEGRGATKADLDAIMGEADVAKEEGFERLLENLSQTKNAYDDIKKTTDKLNTKMFVESSENAYKASKGFSAMNTELQSNTNLLGTSRKKFTNLNNAYLDSVKAMSKAAKSRKGTAAELTTTITTYAASFAKEAADVLTEAEAIQKRTESVISDTEKHKERLAEIEKTTTTTEINQAAVQQAQAITGTSTPTPGAGQAEASNPLASQFNIKEGGIKVYLDGKEIAANIDTSGLILE